MKRSLLFTFILAWTCMSLAQVANDDRILLQGFYWESSHDRQDDWYEYVESLIPELNDANIDMIWLPPPSDAGSWEGYLPRELNNFDNDYGTLGEHQSLLNALNSNGIEAIADIVVNHRVGMTNWVDFSNPSWGTNSIVSNDEVWSEPEYSSITLRGNNDTGTSYAAARDIDHTQTFVQNDIKAWMDNLKAFGYSGWRYDFVHGFGTQYFAMYNAHTNPTFSVGENWTSDKQTIQDWIDATGSNAFDFPTYYSLKGAIRDNNYSYLAYEGAPSGGIGWDPKNYTTFIENHDTPDYDPDNNILNGNNVGQAYAYLLTHPGVPCIFWSHLFEWGSAVQNEIAAAAQARKDAGVHSQSAITILQASTNVYAARISGNNADLIVKLGPGNWGDPNAEGISGTWTLRASGNNYAIWSNGSGDPDPDPDPTSFTVYSQGYTHAYAWDDDQNALLGAWPGTAMNSNGDWMTVAVNAECINIIFSNNGSNQTDDLSTCSDTPYYYEGQWYDSDPSETDPDPDPDPDPTSFTIYTQGYTHAHAWDDNENALLGAWPGTAMSNDGDWVKVTVDVACTNIIFSNNGRRQTDDLYTCSDTPYYYEGQWYGSDPTASPDPDPDPDPTSFTVYTQGYSHAYAWDDNQNALLGAWPGTALSSSGDWMTVTIDATCTNIIFSNNGSDQTADLATCSDTPYYYEGLWYDSDPTANDGGGGTSTLNIYVQGYSHYYAWDDDGNVLAGSWPGSSLVDQGNGWSMGSIDAACANVIFSNNGRRQTADLYACGPEAYWNGSSWSSSANARISTDNGTGASFDFGVFPVPFVDEMTVSFSLDYKQAVSVIIYAVTGQQVRIVNQQLSAGDYSFKVRRADLGNNPGIYTAKMLINDQVLIRKIILN